MRRSFTIIFSLMAALSLLLSACAPQAAKQAPASEAAAPAAGQPAAQAPAASEEGALPEVDPGKVTGNVITAGSSTVYPLSEAVVALFKSEGYTGDVTIDSIGSGAGIERFCVSGETDIANSSRAIKESEIEACKAIGRTPIEFRVGTDAIAIVVNPENNFLTDLSMEDLAKIFSDQVQTWADVNPAWPAEPIKRYAPGTDSGTYDYFIEEVMVPAYGDDENAARAAFQKAANLQQSEDDNVLVQGVEGDKYAIGFFGFAYFQENRNRLKAVSLDGIEPNAETAESGTYPLARPLYIYSDARIMREKPQVAAFINFYLTRVNDVIEEVGYFPASDEALNAARQAWLDAQ